MQPHHFLDAVHGYFEGYSWGVAAARANQPKAIMHLIRNGEVEGLHYELQKDIRKLFLREDEPADIIQAWDDLVDAHPDLEEAREMGIDMLSLAIILQKTLREGEEFLESEAWESFEEELADRGTELMSAMTYLADCLENEVEPAFDDFLYGFQLESDEPYQDEFFIYEEMLARQGLLEAPVEDIIREGNAIEGELAELFTPLMLFFKGIHLETPPGLPEILKKSKHPAVHAGVLFLLCRLERAGKVSIF
ncbi:MAG: hypothetical protein H6581_11040 [Bacteroidia bacterium]|nr:hypothetical protein [Bacteroidia bacterium]